MLQPFSLGLISSLKFNLLINLWVLGLNFFFSFPNSLLYRMITHRTFTNGISLFLSKWTFLSNISIADSSSVRSFYKSTNWPLITWLRSWRYFLNILTWNKLCTANNYSGNAKWYATFPTLFRISNGLIILVTTSISFQS